MKRIRTILYAALAAVVVLGCTEVAPQPEALEMMFSFADADVETKAYVTGSSLQNADGTWRDVLVTAHLHAQSGADVNYIEGATFSRSGSTWRHIPAIYWPMGGSLDILALSTTTPLDDFDIKWGVPSSADRVRIAVPESRTQDDFLFGSVWGASSSAGAATSIGMQHAQAWLQVNWSLYPGVTTLLKVDEVVVHDIYYGGDLTVTNNHGDAEAQWDFRRFEARDRSLEDVSGGNLGTLLSPAVTYSLAVLVPEQEQTSITVKYTVNGVHTEKTIDLPHERWIMGRKYVYDFVLKATTPIDPFNNHEYVDLGVRDGAGRRVLFADRNIGASAPEDFGAYFAWGEKAVRNVTFTGNTITAGSAYAYATTPYYSGSGSSYTKYTSSDGYMTLLPADDAATVLWGGSWRLPEQSDFTMLVQQTTATTTDNYNDTGVAGTVYRGKGDYASSTLFIPAAGMVDGTTRTSVGTSPYLWTRTRYNNQQAYVLSGSTVSAQARYKGFPIRPVIIAP